MMDKGFAAVGAVLTMHPWVALLVAEGLAGLWMWRRAGATLIAAVAWATYAGYEYLMLLRVLCSGDCNIRVDLLLVYPVLLLLTIVALVCTYQRGRSRA